MARVSASHFSRRTAASRRPGAVTSPASRSPLPWRGGARSGGTRRSVPSASRHPSSLRAASRSRDPGGGGWSSSPTCRAVRSVRDAPAAAPGRRRGKLSVRRGWAGRYVERRSPGSVRRPDLGETPPVRSEFDQRLRVRGLPDPGLPGSPRQAGVETREHPAGGSWVRVARGEELVLTGAPHQGGLRQECNELYS